MMEPVWKPCFVCGEKVEVPHVDAEYLVPVCGPCRRKSYAAAEAVSAGKNVAEKVRQIYQDDDGKLWEVEPA